MIESRTRISQENKESGLRINGPGDVEMQQQQRSNDETESKRVNKLKSGYQVRPGERICRSYLQTGLCDHGTNCLFNHPTCKVLTYHLIFISNLLKLIFLVAEVNTKVSFESFTCSSSGEDIVRTAQIVNSFTQRTMKLLVYLIILLCVKHFLQM